jgi:AmmeMemoRadiSam system protein A
MNGAAKRCSSNAKKKIWMASLADCEKKALLEVARRALVAAVQRHEPMDNSPGEGALACPGSAFVTLFLRKRLRGCIGQLPCQTELVDVVAHCAKAAASEDPRFTPVRPEELPHIEIELSVLSPLIDIPPEQIEPGKHGLMVSNNERRGVLLPQVATQFHWNGIRFLEATCEKAGLSKDAWKARETRVQAFTAEVFSEAEFQRDLGSSYSTST